MTIQTKYIVIDTEGSGLFKHKDEAGNVVRSDAPGQPRMAEFACALCDEDFNVEKTFQSYIFPNEWDHEMSQEVIDIHGLTMEKLRADGDPVELALGFYLEAVREGRVVAGYNQQHDGRQVRAELRRAKFDDMFEQTQALCLMRSITTNMKGQVKKLNGKGGFPRLIDACAHFGIEYPEDKRHSALEDVLATVKLGAILKQHGALLTPAVHYAKGGVSSEA